MLDLEQQLIRQWDYDVLPSEYGAAIEKYRPADLR
jgi:hypothetical protein